MAISALARGPSRAEDSTGGTLVPTLPESRQPLAARSLRRSPSRDRNPHRRDSSHMPPSRRGRRATVGAGVIATRLGMYLILTWGTLIVLSRGLFTGSESLALALAIYSMVPLVVFALFRGWPFYPGAARSEEHTSEL